MIDLPSKSLIGDLIPINQQVLANAIGYWFVGSFTVITDLAGGVGLWKLTNSKYTDEQITLVFGSCLVVFLVVMTCIASHEEQFTQDAKVKNPFIDIFRAFKAVDKQVLGISICFMFSRISIFAFETNGTDYFAVDIFHGDSLGDDKQRQNYNDGVSFGMLVNGIGAVYTSSWKYFRKPFAICCRRYFSVGYGHHRLNYSENC
jgi:solute carrier family 45 protein 1/2/4